jgi:hypothetical protein
MFAVCIVSEIENLFFSTIKFFRNVLCGATECITASNIKPECLKNGSQSRNFEVSLFSVKVMILSL